MRFEYCEPKDLDEAVALLGKYGSKAKIIAGGTDLMVKINHGMLKPDYVIDIEGINGLDSIEYSLDNGLKIGALVKINSIENSPIIKEEYPVLACSSEQIGSIAVRNLATIGGNLCNASPSADNAPPLLCLGADVIIYGPQGERTLPLEQFFIGPGQTALGGCEIMIGIKVPSPVPGMRATYSKHGRRGNGDLAIVSVALALNLNGDIIVDASLALGSVAPTPIRAKMAEAMLTGKKLTTELIETSSLTASEEACCISDVRASEEYRKEMVKVFTRRALKSFLS